MNKKTPLHVMHIIESLEFGGAEKVLVHLANMLSGSYKVSVCLTKRKGELVDQLNSEIPIHFLDTGEGNSIELPKKLAKLLVDEKVDILHSHDWGIYLESAFATRKARTTKLIHTVHGHYVRYSDGWSSKIKKLLRNYLEKRAANYTFKIVPVSDSIKQYIVDDIGINQSKIQRIHNGIADLASSERPIEKVNSVEEESDKSVFRLITVGRIAKIKNYPLLISALAKALKDNKNIFLDVVGDGPETDSLKDLVKHHHLDNHVRFLGFRTDIKELLLQNDAFVLSSDYEGISIAILEAMSLSMPVIATRVGGVPETIIDGETGCLVDKGDEQGYASALLKLANSAELRVSMGQQARRYFEKHFDESVVLEQYKTLYKSALS